MWRIESVVPLKQPYYKSKDSVKLGLTDSGNEVIDLYRASCYHVRSFQWKPCIEQTHVRSHVCGFSTPCATAGAGVPTVDHPLGPSAGPSSTRYIKVLAGKNVGIPIVRSSCKVSFACPIPQEVWGASGMEDKHEG